MICGIDEAGRGPLAGPVVIAGVIFNSKDKIAGVDDSKKLSALKREILFDKIIKKCFAYHIEIVGHKFIDEHNILKATMKGMQKCMRKFENLDCKYLVDGHYLKFPDDEHKKYDFQTIIKGDSFIYEISAASIIAKVTRDRIMKIVASIFPEYDFENNKGYPTKKHIEKVKSSGLTPIHRLSFCKKFILNGVH